MGLYVDYIKICNMHRICVMLIFIFAYVCIVGYRRRDPVCFIRGHRRIVENTGTYIQLCTCYLSVYTIIYLIYTVCLCTYTHMHSYLYIGGAPGPSVFPQSQEAALALVRPERRGALGKGMYIYVRVCVCIRVRYTR